MSLSLWEAELCGEVSVFCYFFFSHVFSPHRRVFVFALFCFVFLLSAEPGLSLRRFVLWILRGRVVSKAQNQAVSLVIPWPSARHS